MISGPEVWESPLSISICSKGCYQFPIGISPSSCFNEGGQRVVLMGENLGRVQGGYDKGVAGVDCTEKVELWERCPVLLPLMERCWKRQPGVGSP